MTAEVVYRRWTTYENILLAKRCCK